MVTHLERQIPQCEQDAVHLEENCVHEVYESIAHHFDATRYSQWPGVKTFLESLDAYSVLLDVGCGNGKYLLPTIRPDLIKIGCDRSSNLLDICSSKEFRTFAGDCVALPVRDESFDTVINIAVIHHLSTEERRLRAIAECLRVLRPGGKALIYVWAFEQKKGAQKSAYLKTMADVDGAQCVSDDRFLPIHKNKTPFRAQDLLVPWTTKDAKDDVTVHRYYHVFKEGDLEELCGKLENCAILKSFYEQGNWCVILSKR